MKTYGEIYEFAIETFELLNLHPIADHLRMWEMDGNVDMSLLWQEYSRFLPVLFSSLQNPINCHYDNDPLEYSDYKFRHEDGTPADFSDIFCLLDTYVRPVFVSTAGWLEANWLAERSVRNIVENVKNKAFFGGFRLGIKRYERLARTNPDAYLSNLKRMMTILWPLTEGKHLDLLFYYDPRIENDKAWAETKARELEEFAVSTLGGSIEGCAHFAIVSHHSGRAYDPRFAEQDFDMNDSWGYEIRPDGNVTWREKGVVVKKTVDGEIMIHPQSPMAKPIDTGVRLW
jgi:hypothetical protein